VGFQKKTLLSIEKLETVFLTFRLLLTLIESTRGDYRTSVFAALSLYFYALGEYLLVSGLSRRQQNLLVQSTTGSFQIHLGSIFKSMKETQTFINTHEFSADVTALKLLQPTLVKEPSTQVLSRSVASLLKSGVSKRDIEEEDPFYVCDLGEIVRQYKQWNELLPRIQPFYAVKCNPDPLVLKTLAKCGTGFDCASKAEVQLALDAGVSSSQIIYANPCKQASHIRYATARGVNVMTFDNADELYKIKQIAPYSQLVLRILTDDSKSLCRFGVKFGASLAIVPILLQIAKELELEVIGIRYKLIYSVSMLVVDVSMLLPLPMLLSWLAKPLTLVQPLAFTLHC
jgi:hypothetical protein